MEPDISVEDIQELIQARAYALWEAEGRPQGMDQKHWFAAQMEILEEVDQSGATGPAGSDVAAPVSPRGGDIEQRQDALLDEAVEETFPASDPISPKQIT